MAAATIDSRVVLQDTPFLITKVVLSALTGDQTEDVAHGGPTGVKPFLVIPVSEVEATSQEVVHTTHAVASDSTTNGTVRIVCAVENGGSITGAKVALYCFFAPTANQAGLSLNNF